MNIKNEINQFASEDHKEALLWLFGKYHKKSEWLFVARCKFERYGVYSYQAHRVWSLTEEGLILYNYAKKIKL
jgi:hypothetical protein